MLKKFPFYTQLNKMDCGPTCLQIVSKYYGKYIPIDNLRDICNFSNEGVSVGDLCKAAEQIGFKTIKTDISYKDLKERLVLPCIMLIQEHFVVLYRVTKSNIYISDPAKGLVKYSKEKFIEQCKKNNTKNLGIVIILEATDSFSGEKRNKNLKVSMMSTLKFLISLLKPYKKQSIQLLFVIIIITMLQSAFPFITQAVVDIGILSGDIKLIYTLLVANLVLIISTSAGTWIRKSMAMHISSRVKISLLSNYLIKFLKLPTIYLEKSVIGDVIQRVRDYQRIETFLMHSAFNMVLAILSIIIFGFILFLYKPILLLIFLIGSLIYILWVLMFWNIRKNIDSDYFKLMGETQGHWIEMFGNILDIKNNNYERLTRWKWEKTEVKLYHVNFRLLNVEQLQQLGAGFISSMRDLLLIFITAIAVINNEMTLGMLVSIQYIIGQLKGPVNEIINFINSFQLAHISFLRINEVNLLKVETSNSNLENTKLTFPKDRTIILRDVTFKYSMNSRAILNKVTLDIRKGKITAIVGESGSGKSTLLKILMRIYRPLSGEINLGFNSINSANLNIWREKISAITQESMLFNDTILNNIILDKDDFDENRFHKIIEKVNLKKEIEILPKGYNTNVGEQGKALSRGQQQRVLLARGLYKKSEYLFLDEATNALDPNNEKFILNNIFENEEGRTIVFISHKPDLVIKADKIIFLKHGRVSEVGNHNLLMKHKKGYYQLFSGNNRENLN
ncbi:peptidase domain-containing ABC transporter [Polaribacter sp. MSW13]|uniref:Peptidase domain-containing ABC transporter n=1 Tax=Polaribacter marinus TaxID=2916838 RepID=A0A9X2AKX7_9FLAO|nr:peptidase domain-containing ABC transporter [Polaribacter marinus]MCI2229948.1 peptidase domain-containing ABC transporter [Polaribacter marinus]